MPGTAIVNGNNVDIRLFFTFEIYDKFNKHEINK